MNKERSRLLYLLCLGFVFRVIGIFSTNFLGFNPFHGFQAPRHAGRASEIAAQLLRLELEFSFSSTFDRWGLLLSVFWLIPGPSGLYAQLAMAGLGTIAVLNLYLIGKYFHSHQAGFLAAVPIALFPSYFFMHSVVQREAIIIFSLTTAFVLLFLPNRYVSKPRNYTLAVIFLLIPAYLRIPNLPVLFIVVFGTLTVAFLHSDKMAVKRKIQAVSVLSVAGITGIVVVIRRFITEQPVQYLANFRARRVRGRATYLEDIVAESIPELVAFSWIGAFYFLFTPLPWHVERIDDVVVLLESMTGLAFALFAAWGALELKERSVAAATALVLGVIVYSVLYGFGTGNYGAGVRHRQTIFWAIFVLGSIGFSSKVRINF